ncbi:MAG: hypothetical protein QGF33_13990, partial [Alphaproteobacteria bacterium]|nr:hypothetical protein [Alphaproteobacteria bacterium]
MVLGVAGVRERTVLSDAAALPLHAALLGAPAAAVPPVRRRGENAGEGATAGAASGTGDAAAAAAAAATTQPSPRRL